MSHQSRPEIPELVEHLFRRQAGRMLSALCGILGLANLDLAEEVVQESLLKALREWPYHGIPENPRAWLVRTAKNHALDILRRESAFRDREPAIANLFSAREDSIPDPSESADENTLADDQLAMVFACCHPLIPVESRVALTLKAVSGLSTGEIARAFLAPEATVAQRIVRAKRRIEEERIELSLPQAPELGERLDSVLQVLYLMFNEGYAARAGESLVRLDLCVEAIRLCRILADRQDTQGPKVHALAALLLLQASRFPARLDNDGELLLLAEQDRSLWDPDLIVQGMHHLSGASAGPELTEYHALAGIAAVHALAQSYQDTDWEQVLSYYDILIQIAPSPVTSLNRAVALSMARGPEVGLAALDALGDPPELRGYYLLPATRAEILTRLGRSTESAECLRAALDCPCSEPERRFLRKKLQENGATC